MNDSDAELDGMSQWIVHRLGPDVPVHFTAFHPDWKMRDRRPTPPATLTRARQIAIRNGIRYAYTGKVHDVAGETTWCSGCRRPLIGRDWYNLLDWHVTADGTCEHCGTRCAGEFEQSPGGWGARRQAVPMGGVTR